MPQEQQQQELDQMIDCLKKYLFNLYPQRFHRVRKSQVKDQIYSFDTKKKQRKIFEGRKNTAL